MHEWQPFGGSRFWFQAAGATEGYMLEPLVYEKADDNMNMKTASLAVPITVVGRGAETRQVLFRSSFDNPTEFQDLRAGEYQVTVLAWLHNSDEPQAADTFRLVVETKDAAQIAKNLRRSKGNSDSASASDLAKVGSAPSD